jgi:hypothetical protein
MTTFYVVQIFKNNLNEKAIDYPKDMPIPNTRDELTIKDEQGVEYSGIVVKKRFVIRDYHEVTIFLNCD